ncbi:ATP-binding cassette domain-containing protein [Streptococcaceae bacterium ESL0687]|nr:ATP-binding cassette domain-containing protein [Streptococcaceae bacterium ESL0687]
MNIIDFKDVDYSIDDLNILKKCNLSIEEGDFLTITGPSGSGKSTILKLAANLISPVSGEIMYDGKNVASLNPMTYRQNVSYCFQQPLLFGKTVSDNLEFPFKIRNKEVDSKKISDFLKEVDLDDSYKTKFINDLSGGERQRIALIRNLLFTPKVLLLDEVTAGLDEKTKGIVLDLIDSTNKKGVTVVRVTHDQKEIDQAKHLIKVVNGEVVK